MESGLEKRHCGLLMERSCKCLSVLYGWRIIKLTTRIRIIILPFLDTRNKRRVFGKIILSRMMVIVSSFNLALTLGQVGILPQTEREKTILPPSMVLWWKWQDVSIFSHRTASETMTCSVASNGNKIGIFYEFRIVSTCNTMFCLFANIFCQFAHTFVSSQDERKWRWSLG